MRSSRLLSTALVTLAVLVATAGPTRADADHPSTDVVGGDLDPHQSPAAGYLAVEFATGWSSPYCGATLIRDNVAVTAAQCLVGASDKGAQRFAFGYGEVGSSLLYVADRIEIHPAYDQIANQGGGNDLALLVFDPPVADISPPRIGDYELGCSYRSFGYGGVLSDPPGGTDERRSATMCIDAAGSTPEGDPDPGVLQLTAENGGLCHGDIGGALIRGGVGDLIGVLSYILDETCPEGGRAVAVNLAEHLPWIEHEVGTAPSIFLISPGAGVPVIGTFAITAGVGDDLRFRRIEIWRGATLLAHSETSWLVTTPWMTLPPGEHAIQVVGYDFDTSTRASYRLTVTAPPPPDAGIDPPDAGIDPPGPWIDPVDVVLASPDAGVDPDAGAPAADQPAAIGCSTTGGGGGALLPLLAALGLTLAGAHRACRRRRGRALR